MLRVRDVMSTEVRTVSPELSLRDTIELLAAAHLTGVPVVVGERAVGVISASDILQFETTMPGVPTERPDQMELGEWGAPEEWEEGREAPAAYFSELWTDVGAEVGERFAAVAGPEWDVLGEHTVAEAMSRALCTVGPDASLALAAHLMTRAGIHRLLILENGRLAGIVTTSDIVRAVAHGWELERRIDQLERRIAPLEELATTVGALKFEVEEMREV